MWGRPLCLSYAVLHSSTITSLEWWPLSLCTVGGGFLSSPPLWMGVSSWGVPVMCSALTLRASSAWLLFPWDLPLMDHSQEYSGVRSSWWLRSKMRMGSVLTWAPSYWVRSWWVVRSKVRLGRAKTKMAIQPRFQSCDPPWPSSFRMTPCQYRIQPHFESHDLSWCNSPLLYTDGAKTFVRVWDWQPVWSLLIDEILSNA